MPYGCSYIERCANGRESTFLDTVEVLMYRPASVILSVQCNAMLCICTGQNIKSRKRPSGRPASVDKNVTLFRPMDRSSLNLEHSFPVSHRRKYFSSSIGSSIRACATINRSSLTAVQILHKFFD